MGGAGRLARADPARAAAAGGAARPERTGETSTPYRAGLPRTLPFLWSAITYLPTPAPIFVGSHTQLAQTLLEPSYLPAEIFTPGDVHTFAIRRWDWLLDLVYNTRAADLSAVPEAFDVSIAACDLLAEAPDHRERATAAARVLRRARADESLVAAIQRGSWTEVDARWQQDHTLVTDEDAAALPELRGLDVAALLGPARARRGTRPPHRPDRPRPDRQRADRVDDALRPRRRARRRQHRDARPRPLPGGPRRDRAAALRLRPGRLARRHPRLDRPGDGQRRDRRRPDLDGVWRPTSPTSTSASPTPTPTPAAPTGSASGRTCARSSGRRPRCGTRSPPGSSRARRSPASPARPRPGPVNGSASTSTRTRPTTLPRRSRSATRWPSSPS